MHPAEMGQIHDPSEESEVLEEATEYLIQQAIKLGEDDEDSDDDDLNKAQTSVMNASPGTAAASEGNATAGKEPHSEASLSAAAEVPTFTKSMAAEDEHILASAAESLAQADSGLMPSDGGMTDEDTDATEQLNGDEWEEGLEDELEKEAVPEISEEQMAQLALATARQSSAWGRIIRPPRKKGRHVIVDICTPIAALPVHRQAELARPRPAALGASLSKTTRGTRVC